MTTSYSVPMPGNCLVIHLTAASETLPTDMVLVSRMGVSSRPHSCTWVSPDTSPAPLSTNAPATARCWKMLEPGHHRRDPGAHRPLAHHQRPLALDQGGVPDPHAFHVGDGVERPHREPPDGKTEIAQASAHGTVVPGEPGRDARFGARPALRAAHRSGPGQADWSVGPGRRLVLGTVAVRCRRRPCRCRCRCWARTPSRTWAPRARRRRPRRAGTALTWRPRPGASRAGA